MVKSKAPVMGYAAQEVEWLMAIYGMSLYHAVWEHPRAATLVLMPTYAQRQGHEGMMSYTDMASAHARQEVTRWINAQFTVVPDSPASVGWRIGQPPAFLAVGTQQLQDTAVNGQERGAMAVADGDIPVDAAMGHGREEQGVEGQKNQPNTGQQKYIGQHHQAMQRTSKPDDWQEGQ